jgi:glycosyltransferase involved in cell wall biosynthesis
MSPIRVLFIHHYGAFSGASRSLLELISGFPPGTIDACVLTPRGRTHEVLTERGIKCIPCSSVALFDNTRYGHYRGLRWFILLRELARLPQTLRSLWRVQREFPDVDIVHINESAMLPAIVAVGRWFRRPTVVHVRAVQSGAPTWASRMFVKVFERNVSAAVAIDETVKRSLPTNLSLPVKVIHNGFNMRPAGESAADARPADPLIVGMVGNLIRVKGCREFVEAATLCRDRKLPVRFVFIGAGEGAQPGWIARLLVRLEVGQNIERELRDLVAQRGLDGYVEFRPFTTDLAAVYRSIDVVCFPSHLDAPGRPIFEAAFFAVPAIAAISDPTPDTFVPGETGLTIRACSSEDIVGAVEHLLEHPQERLRLGNNACRLVATQFNAQRNARLMLDLYRDLLAREGEARALGA